MKEKSFTELVQKLIDVCDEGQEHVPYEDRTTTFNLDWLRELVINNSDFMPLQVFQKGYDADEYDGTNFETASHYILTDSHPVYIEVGEYKILTKPFYIEGIETVKQIRDGIKNIDPLGKPLDIEGLQELVFSRPEFDETRKIPNHFTGTKIPDINSEIYYIPKETNDTETSICKLNLNSSKRMTSVRIKGKKKCPIFIMLDY
jgi:hypothetical protein